MEHLMVHLPYEAQMGGPVQYRWMYPFERFMFYLKRKVRNNNKVEGSISAQYVYEEITTFCSRYFRDELDTIHNRLQRNEVVGNVEEDKLSIFQSDARPFGKGKRRLLLEKERNAAELYILDNCEEVTPFAKQCRDEIILQNPTFNENDVVNMYRKTLSEWFKCHVRKLEKELNPQIARLSYGPHNIVRSYDSCYVNGYRFKTEKSGIGLTTQNCGVMVCGSCYEEDNLDYYGVLKEVLELEYSDGCKLVLFLCDWYDPVQGVIHDERHGIVDVIAGKYIRRYEPFILASQAHQVCYVPHVTSKRKNDEYYTVLKIKARSYVEETKESNEELNELYQVENEQPPSVIVDDDLDDVSTIPLPSYIENEEDDDEDELEDDVEEDVEEEDEEEDCGENFDED